MPNNSKNYLAFTKYIYKNFQFIDIPSERDANDVDEDESEEELSLSFD